VPALAMIAATPKEIRVHVERLRSQIAGVSCQVIAGESVIGGGSTPDQALPTWLLAIDGDAVAIEKALRANDPPVIARILEDKVVVDLRTVLPEEEAQLALAIRNAVAG
jgi:L-seryl-tRNA(Ser) seleniumtransferase